MPETSHLPSSFLGSRRKTTAATSENEELVEVLICSHEEYADAHYSIREFASALSASKNFAHHMVKIKGFHVFKHLTTTHMTRGCITNNN